MTPQEQKAVFDRLQHYHPDWTPKFISGYVHGANDAGDFSHPKRDFIVTARKRDDYGLGYLLGFAIRYGEDCESERWFSLIAPLAREAKAE